jgi:hypothetical protein
MEKYNVRLEPNEYASIGTKAKKEWSSFINNENCHLCSPEALDLLNRMLIYDHVRFNPFNNKIFRLRELLRNKLWPINSLTQSDTWYNKFPRQQIPYTTSVVIKTEKSKLVCAWEVVLVLNVIYQKWELKNCPSRFILFHSYLITALYLKK